MSRVIDFQTVKIYNVLHVEAVANMNGSYGTDALSLLEELY